MESFLKGFKPEGIRFNFSKSHNFEGIHTEGLHKEGILSDSQQVESNKKSFESFMLFPEKYAILHLERGGQKCNPSFTKWFSKESSLMIWLLAWKFKSFYSCAMHKKFPFDITREMHEMSTDVRPTALCCSYALGCPEFFKPRCRLCHKICN